MAKTKENIYVSNTGIKILKMLMPVGMSYRMIGHQFPDQDITLRTLNTELSDLKRQGLLTINRIGYHIITEKGKDILYGEQ